MILKFIYGRQIHLYDLKEQESFDHACEKIRMMFKRLPEQFVLIYRNSEQLELEIDSNEQLDQLIHDLKANAKMIKLYITDIMDRKLNSQRLQVEKNVIQQNIIYCQVQNLQQVGKQLQQESVPFTTLNKPNEQEAQTIVIDSQYQRIQSSDKKQFQQLDSSDQQDNEVEREVKNYLKDKMENICFDQHEERQLDKNQMENSDPTEMKNLGQGKYNLNQKEMLQRRQQEENTDGVVQTESIKLQQQVSEVNSHSMNLSGVEKLPFSQRKKIFQHYQPKPRSQPEDIHCHRARCDRCHVTPIIGTRYKCVICPDYDLCQNCEQSYSHSHPLLKIRFTYQTPVSINVSIPQPLNPIQQNQPQLFLQNFDLSQLDVEQRKQRVATIASELSDLLDIDFHQCFKFIRQNERYTKESLTQLMIRRKDGKGLKGDKIKQGKKQEKGSGINGIIGNFKGLFSSFISN